METIEYGSILEPESANVVQGGIGSRTPFPKNRSHPANNESSEPAVVRLLFPKQPAGWPNHQWGTMKPWVQQLSMMHPMKCVCVF